MDDPTIPHEQDFETIEVQATPSGINCLSWSTDGDLALAAGEYVHIFTPKTPSTQRDPNDPLTGHAQWHSFRIKINTFTFEEWPQVKSAPFSIFSIGEEQSSSTVSAISWSPPGLGIHRRCILGVLTTNLVLSLWETNGELGKWERVTVVNSALESHWDEPTNDQDLLRKKRRIRSFCWSPPYMVQDVSHVPDSSRERWGRCYMAVATDDHDVAVLTVKRERTSQSVGAQWNTQVITSYKLSDSASMFNLDTVERDSLFADFVAASGLINGLSWSPWLTSTSELVSSTAKSLLGVVQGRSLILLEVSDVKEPVETNETSTLCLRRISISGHNIEEKRVDAIEWQPLVCWSVPRKVPANSNRSNLLS